MKRTPIQRTGSLKKMSPKRRKESALYAMKRRAFLAEFPLCEVLAPGCAKMATEIHHKEKRGVNFLNIGTWLPVCSVCHRWIHEHPAQARKLGFLK